MPGPQLFALVILAIAALVLYHYYGWVLTAIVAGLGTAVILLYIERVCCLPVLTRNTDGKMPAVDLTRKKKN